MLSRVINRDYKIFSDVWKEKRFDLSIDDPPYGIGESSKNHNSRNTPVVQKNGEKLKIKSSNYLQSDWDQQTPEEEYFDYIKKIAKNNIVFGANYFKSLIGKPQKPPRRNEYEKFLQDNPVGWIIWDKMNGTNDFSDCEIIYTTFDFPSHIIYFMWNGMMQGTYCGPDYDKAKIQQGNKKLNEKRIHPTQKPIPVYDYLFDNYSGPNQTVVDHFVGSGSSRISAHRNQINYVGFESNKSHYLDQEKRFKVELQLPRLIFDL